MIHLKNALRKNVERIVEILIHGELEYAELQGSLVALLYGIWFLISVLIHTPVRELSVTCTQDILAQLIPPAIVGVFAVLLGINQLIALILNRTKFRRVVSLTAFLFWFFMGVLVARQDWRLVTVPWLFAFSVGAAWAYIRVMFQPGR